MTHADHASALERFGYTPRQSRFLALVALHSGYFVRRQYVTFIERAHGATTVAFLSDVLRRGHATTTVVPHLGQVYHVAAKALYRSLDQADNRNRRLQGAGTIRRRLMAVDFVLAHREFTWLATEHEKVAYFSGALSIPMSVLPCALYTGRRGEGEVRRYFVEKFPIAKTADDRVVVSYIDDDDATPGGLATFVTRYRALFTCLRHRVELVLVTTTAHHVQRAADVVRKCFGEQDAPPTIDAVRTYVDARRRLEQGGLTGRAQHELDGLRRDLAAMPQADGDLVYRLWQTHGDAALALWVQERARVRSSGGPRLGSHVLPFTYGVPAGSLSYRA